MEPVPLHLLNLVVSGCERDRCGYATVLGATVALTTT